MSVNCFTDWLTRQLAGGCWRSLNCCFCCCCSCLVCCQSKCQYVRVVLQVWWRAMLWWRGCLCLNFSYNCINPSLCSTYSGRQLVVVAAVATVAAAAKCCCWLNTAHTTVVATATSAWGIAYRCYPASVACQWPRFTLHLNKQPRAYTNTKHTHLHPYTYTWTCSPGSCERSRTARPGCGHLLSDFNTLPCHENCKKATPLIIIP